MLKREKLKELDEKINQMKIELNQMAVDGLNKSKIITFSQELDLLINKYYNLQLKN